MVLFEYPPVVGVCRRGVAVIPIGVMIMILFFLFFRASPRFWYATYAESFFSYMLDRFMPFLVSNIVDNVGVG